MPTAKIATRQEAAAALLAVTPVQALRKETRRNRDWALVYRGFRAETLTQSLFIRGAREFGANERRLFRLCSVFLDSLGAPEHGGLPERFTKAAALPHVDDNARDLCVSLGGVDFLDLPANRVIEEAATALGTSAQEASRSHSQTGSDSLTIEGDREPT